MPQLRRSSRALLNDPASGYELGSEPATWPSFARLLGSGECLLFLPGWQDDLDDGTVIGVSDLASLGSVPFANELVRGPAVYAGSFWRMTSSGIAYPVAYSRGWAHLGYETGTPILGEAELGDNESVRISIVASGELNTEGLRKIRSYVESVPMQLERTADD